MPRFVTKFLLIRNLSDGLRFLLVHDRLTGSWSLPATDRQQFKDLNDLVIRTFNFDRRDFEIEAIRYNEKDRIRNLCVSLKSDIAVLRLYKKSRMQWITELQTSELKTMDNLIREVGLIGLQLSG